MDWQSDPGYLIFLVRIWNETLSGDTREWRGQIKNITSGEVRYFRDLQTLLSYFEHRLQSRSMIPDDDPTDGTREAGKT